MPMSMDPPLSVCLALVYMMVYMAQSVPRSIVRLFHSEAVRAPGFRSCAVTSLRFILRHPPRVKPRGRKTRQIAALPSDERRRTSVPDQLSPPHEVTLACGAGGSRARGHPTSHLTAAGTPARAPPPWPGRGGRGRPRAHARAPAGGGDRPQGAPPGLFSSTNCKLSRLQLGCAVPHRALFGSCVNDDRVNAANNKLGNHVPRAFDICRPRAPVRSAPRGSAVGLCYPAARRCN
jgi:hypothetical protein